MCTDPMSQPLGSYIPVPKQWIGLIGYAPFPRSIIFTNDACDICLDHPPTFMPSLGPLAAIAQWGIGDMERER